MERDSNDFIYHCEIGVENSNIFIMQREGKAVVMASLYNNDNTGFISDLSVNENSRKKGLGRKILSEAERAISVFGKEFCQLKVLTGSWMEDWYKRVGYSFLYRDGNYSFMIKTLNKE